MSILVDLGTRVLVQGITGSAGLFHARQMLEYGTRVVGGVTPGRGGQRFEAPYGGGFQRFGDVASVPIHTVADAVRATEANATCIFVPPAGAADAILEAFDAGLLLVAASPRVSP